MAKVNDNIKDAHWELFSFGYFEDDTIAFIFSNCGMIVDVFLTEGNYNPKDMDYNYCPICTDLDE